MYISKWKKPIWEGYISYNSNYMTFWNRQNYKDCKKSNGCWGLGWREMKRQNAEDGAVKIIHMILQRICITIYLSKLIQWATPKVNTNVNYGLWMVMRCQYRLVNCNECTTFVGDIDNWAAYACTGTGGAWEISAWSPQFFCPKSSKTALKVLKYKNNTEQNRSKPPPTKSPLNREMGGMKEM